LTIEISNSLQIRLFANCLGVYDWLRSGSV